MTNSKAVLFTSEQYGIDGGVLGEASQGDASHKILSTRNMAVNPFSISMFGKYRAFPDTHTARGLISR